MAHITPTKAALVAALIAAAVFGPTPRLDDARAAMLLFGVVNVLFSPQGTAWVRGAAVVAVIAALLQSNTVFTAVALLAWLVWPPAYVVAWAARRQRTANWEPATENTARQARIALAAAIVAVAVGAVVYRALVWHRLDQTAALFVGIPALLAIVVVFTVSPKSAVGVACKAVTIGLLVSLLFLWEGVLCILMSAPLFFLVAVIIGTLVEQVRHQDRKPQTLFCSLALLTLVPMSLEGVTDATSLIRDERITESRIVRAPIEAVTRAMFDVPRFDRVLPLYLRAGFPRPAAVRLHRDGDCPRWVVRFRGGEMKVNGMEPRAGDLVLELTEARPGFARWRAVSDDSHMTHFLSWRESIVQWEAVAGDMTRVTWTVRYRRDLDPAWYFGPWERYAVRLAAGYLIDAVATP